LKRTFERERAVTTDFNAVYQEIFSRVTKTPAEIKKRIEDLERHVDKFVGHTKVASLRHS
jgi:hypothetical protein